jgi:hypothetical protein
MMKCDVLESADEKRIVNENASGCGVVVCT